jgi:hypothetical protein
MSGNTKNITFGASRLQLKKFPIHKMAEHCTIAMIAKRASGKSYLTREILYHKRNIPAVTVISKTEKLNRFYGDFCPDSYIFDNFDTDILSKIYQRQAKLNEDNSKRKKEGKKQKDDSLMLIMDDCMSSKGDWLKDPQILELFFNGRHHHISFILTMQFSLGIPPELRSNFDYIFLLAEDFTNNRKRLYEHYAGMFPTLAVFEQVFGEITENYGVMVIDNRVHSKNIADKVYWYKAKDVPDFTVGSPKYKRYHKEHFDREWNKRLPIFDPGLALAKKRNNIKLVVEKIRN